MGYLKNNLSYIFFELDMPVLFKLKYFFEKVIKWFVIRTNRYFKLNISCPYLFRKDYVLKTKKGYFWKIKAKSDFDYTAKEMVEGSLSKHFVCESGIFLDVGAHMGKWSVIVGKNYPNCQVFSFEPNPNTFQYLEANIKLNNLNNIIPINKVVSIEKSVLSFNMEPELSCISKVVDSTSETGSNVINIDAIDIDSFLSEQKIEPNMVKLIKIDVEGHEFEVLKGSEYFLSNTSKGSRIICEILDAQENRNNIIEFMKSFNFSCEVLETKCDYLFTKQ